MNPKTDRELWEETHRDGEETRKDVAALMQAVKGYNGRGGLCQQVENHTKQIARLWIVVTVILCTTGGSAYGIIRLLVGG